MQTLKVGVIGAGGIAAKLHLPEITSVPGAEVVVLSGRRQSRLETLCRKFNVPRWTHSYDEVIADPRIDAVIVALPHPLHVKYGLAALSAGKHVHMQKPLSTSLQEAEQFVQAAERSEKTVLALPFVARPHVLAARQLIARGILGTISSAHARFSHGGPEVYYATIQAILDEEPEEELWFFDARKADVGALFDMGVYSIAHLVTLVGSVKSVMCRCATVAKPTRLEDTAALLLDFESGAIGTAETGWCDGARTYGFSVHGTQGKLVNPPLTGDLVHYQPSSLVDEDAPLRHEPVDTSAFPSVHSHQHWVDCIRLRAQPPLTNARTAWHVTEVMLAGLESARTGRAVDVKSRVNLPHPS
jgi:predicted dehydrogenase